jgi:hypothetical protein
VPIHVCWMRRQNSVTTKRQLTIVPSKVDALLRAIGWAIVPLDVPKHHRRDSALQ